MEDVMKLSPHPGRSRDLRRRVAVRWLGLSGNGCVAGCCGCRTGAIWVPLYSETQLADKKDTHRSRTGASESCILITHQLFTVTPTSERGRRTRFRTLFGHLLIVSTNQRAWITLGCTEIIVVGGKNVCAAQMVTICHNMWHVRAAVCKTVLWSIPIIYLYYIYVFSSSPHFHVTEVERHVNTIPTTKHEHDNVKTGAGRGKEGYEGNGLETHLEPMVCSLFFMTSTITSNTQVPAAPAAPAPAPAPAMAPATAATAAAPAAPATGARDACLEPRYVFFSVSSHCTKFYS